MGWSCSKAANDVLRSWTQACVLETGSQNTFLSGGKKYFYELSRVEHDDGAITGTIQRVVRELTDGRSWCRRTDSFRIDGGGRVVRGPKSLKDAARDVVRGPISLIGSGGPVW